MEELPNLGPIGAIQAKELLSEVAGLRRAARRPIGLWPPLVIFGAVAVAGAPAAALNSLADGLWWLAAAPLAFVGLTVCGTRQARRRGLEGQRKRMLALGIASFAAGWLLCLGVAAALRLPADLGWTIALAVGYLAWSRFARSLPAAVVAVALAIIGTALVLSSAPSWAVQLGVGAGMIIGGLVLRYGPEAS